MRTYGLPVNADLIEMLDPDLVTWNEYIRLMHEILELEFIIGSTGGATQSRLQNDCKPARLVDFW